jgi:transcriptional regulator with XRE-family HTH domain
MPKKEMLRDYVSRVCREKNLTASEVERNSRGEISEAYVRGLIQGTSKNPTIDKLSALARGLGRPEDEVFAVARGIERSEDESRDSEVSALMDRARELTAAEDRSWFDETIKMLDREVERRLKAKKR